MKFILGQKIIDKIRGKKYPYQRVLKSHYGIKHIYTGVDANKIIYNSLVSNSPTFVARFGSVELATVFSYLESLKFNTIDFSEDIKKMMSDNAGFFPSNNYNLSRFSSEFINLLPNIDILGVWFNEGEERISLEFAQNIRFVHLEDLNPLNGKHKYIKFVGAETYQFPWTRALRGKKVLVVHPFSETIKLQYEKRKLLFKNQDILPDFELITFKAVQSIADEKENLPFSSWFEALDYMKEEISKIDFDIALIGCGAYGIFLGHFCKTLGKKAVHLGGACQLLFGIIGKRWQTEYKIETNEHWTTPSDTERPRGFEKVEKGCYW